MITNFKTSCTLVHFLLSCKPKSENSCEELSWYADEFFKGNYSFEQSKSSGIRLSHGDVPDLR